MIFWNRGIRIPHDKEPAASRGILPFSPAGPVLVPLCYGDTSEALPAAAAGAQIGRGEVLSDPGGDTPSLATVTGPSVTRWWAKFPARCCVPGRKKILPHPNRRF